MHVRPSSPAAPIFALVQGRGGLATVSLVMALLTAACVPHIYERFDIDAGGGATLDAQQRVVLVTHRGGRHKDRLVVCAEPSPDAMSAIATAIAARGGNGQVQASLGGALSQTAAYIGIRTPTIQLLRDGLFRACEGYLNGVITGEDYQIILRNYDRVMVALLAIDAAGGFPHQPPVTIAGGAVTVGDASGGQTGSSGAGSSAATPKSGAQSGAQSQSAGKTGAKAQSGAQGQSGGAGGAGAEIKIDAPGNTVAQVNAVSGISNGDQVMKTVADYMLDNQKWLAATCLTVLENIAKIPPDRLPRMDQLQRDAVSRQIEACGAQLPAAIQFKDRRQYSTDAAAVTKAKAAPAKKPTKPAAKKVAAKPAG
jgi:hypothetical protein